MMIKQHLDWIDWEKKKLNYDKNQFLNGEKERIHLHFWELK